MTPPPTPGAGYRRNGVLLYGMYDPTGLDRAPKVRIEMMTRALAGRAHTERIVGKNGRARTVATIKWIAGGGLRRVGAVYVEAATTTAMPNDLLFLLLMRLFRLRVGVYFRDAYQLYRDIYPRRRLRVIADLAWRLTTPILAHIAAVRYVQSVGLGKVLGLRSPQMLPPGTDPESPFLGAGKRSLVAYVGATGWADGYDTLIEAMGLVRERCPEATLLAVGRITPERQAALPDYVQARQAGRDDLVELLRDARVCVIPRPIIEYTSFVLPIKLWDYLSYGKPIVATAATETVRLLETSGAAIFTPDTPQGLADGIVRMLSEDGLAERSSTAARAFAVAPQNTWAARARTVLESLRVTNGAAAGEPPTTSSAAQPPASM